jgi:hypothetical protein
MTLPTFQAQNPAISHYPLGWASCTAFAGAMAASYDKQVAEACTGGQVRTWTGDTIGGTNLAQIDDALRTHVGVDLDTRYRLPWASFAKAINDGRAAILQGGYSPIAASRFDAGGGFTGNHAITVFPGWIVMDPLADGRRAGIYKYHGEAYPQALLESFAGKLNLVAGRVSPLGQGYVYAAFTRDNVHTYHMSFLGGSFFVFTVNSAGTVTGRRSMKFGAPTGAPCDPPRLHPWPGHSSVSAVRISKGLLTGQYVGINQPAVRLDEIP